MGFTSRGLSWAGGIYQKLEDICTDSNMAQTSCKYMEAINEHVRKILDKDASHWPNPSEEDPSMSSLNVNQESCDEYDKKSTSTEATESDGCLDASNLSLENIVGDWKESVGLDLSDEHNKKLTSSEATRPDDCVDGPISNLSSENIVEDYTESRVGLDENAVYEKLPACVKVELIVSSEEDLRDQDLSQQNESDECEKNTISTEATRSDFSDGAGENCINVTNLVESLPTPVHALPSDDEFRPSESQQDELMGRSMLSGFASSIDIHEVTDGWDMEGALDYLDVVNLDTEQMEILEDVYLEDYWDDLDHYELALISHRASNNMSYKKKLIRALVSTLRSSMGHSRVDSFYHDIVCGIQSRHRIDASSISSADFFLKKPSTHDLCESDWELL